MPQNYNQGGSRAPKKPIINKWEGEGIVKPRTGNEGDEIKFFPFNGGGGAIHITVACSEMTGTADANGQPRIVTYYIPVNVMTNKLITEQQLKGVRTGMKVHVVGKLQQESYTSKQTGQKVTRMVVNAFVFEILEMPQYSQQPVYGAPQPGAYGPQTAPAGYGPQPGGYGPQPGAPAPYPAPAYGGAQPGGYPAPPAGYGPQPGGYGAQPAPAGYGQQPAAPAGYGQPQQGAQQNTPTAPPYYRAPGYGAVPGYAQAPAPAAAPAPVPGEDDLPLGNGENINV